MLKVPENVIAEIRDRVDMVELIGGYVDLKRSGQELRRAVPLPPGEDPVLQRESGPRHIYHCFGCGVTGDAYRFLMEHDHLSFPEALRDLAGRVGIDLAPYEKRGGGDAGSGGGLRSSSTALTPSRSGSTASCSWRRTRRTAARRRDRPPGTVRRDRRRVSSRSFGGRLGPAPEGGGPGRHPAVRAGAGRARGASRDNGARATTTGSAKPADVPDRDGRVQGRSASAAACSGTASPST